MKLKRREVNGKSNRKEDAWDVPQALRARPSSRVLRYILVAPFGFQEETVFRDTFGMDAANKSNLSSSLRHFCNGQKQQKPAKKTEGARGSDWEQVGNVYPP